MPAPGYISPKYKAILASIKNGHKTVGELAEEFEQSHDAVLRLVIRMRNAGEISAWGYSPRYGAGRGQANVIYQFVEVPTGEPYTPPKTFRPWREQPKPATNEAIERHRAALKAGYVQLRKAYFPIPVGKVATSVFDLAKGLK